MLFEDVWEIHDSESDIGSDAFKKLRCESKPMSYAEWKELHLNNKEEAAVYTTLEITFKSGDTISYNKDEWDDYSYDGKSIAVKKNGAWVGIYNFDNVFCVELKTNKE